MYEKSFCLFIYSVHVMQCTQFQCLYLYLYFRLYISSVDVMFQSLVLPVYSKPNCDFSFAGLLSSVQRIVANEEASAEFGRTEGIHHNMIGYSLHLPE